MLVVLVLVFFNLAASATGSGLALSLWTAKEPGPRDEPDRRLTIFWCVLFFVMPVGILLLERAIPGLIVRSTILSTIQSMITVSSIPVFFVLMALFIAFIREIRSDICSGAVANAVSPSRAWRWTDDALPPEAAKHASDPAKPEAYNSKTLRKQTHLRRALRVRRCSSGLQSAPCSSYAKR